jgi:hypothetical protein
LEDRHEELFGTASIPIEVGGGADEPPVPVPGAAPSAAPEPAPSSSSTSNKHNRSEVWEDFEELFELRNGEQIRVNAKCNYCKKTLSARSSAGTSHLLRHIKSCKPRLVGTNAMSQSLLRFNPDGSVHHWEYSPEVARTSCAG